MSFENSDNQKHTLLQPETYNSNNYPIKWLKGVNSLNIRRRVNDAVKYVKNNLNVQTARTRVKQVVKKLCTIDIFVLSKTHMVPVVEFENLTDSYAFLCWLPRYSDTILDICRRRLQQHQQVDGLDIYDTNKIIKTHEYMLRYGTQNDKQLSYEMLLIIVESFTGPITGITANYIVGLSNIADSLLNAGYNELGERILELTREAEEVYETERQGTVGIRRERRGILMDKSIYNDRQNVHTVNNCTLKSIQLLVEDYTPDAQLDTYFQENITKLYTYYRENKSIKMITTSSDIAEFVERVNYDFSAIGGVSITKLFCCVCEFISRSEHKQELTQRLLEEIHEMVGLCTTGHVARLVNVCSGYHSSIGVSITEDERAVAVICSKVNKLLVEDTELNTLILEGETKGVYSHILKHSIIQELADYLGISRGTVEKHIKKHLQC